MKDQAIEAYKSGRVEASIVLLEKAIAEDPKDRQALILFAEVFYGEKRYGEAITQINAALDLEKDANAMYLKATIQTANKQPKIALESFQEVTKLDPGFLPAYFAAGDVYSGMFEIEKAVSEYSKAIRLDINNPEHRTRAAWLHLRHNKAEWALCSYKNALRLSEAVTVQYPALVYILLTAGMRDTAKEALEDLRDIYGASPDVAVCEGLLQWYDAQFEEALASFAYVLGVRPDDAQNVEFLSRLFQGSGVFEKVEPLLASYDEGSPMYADVCYYRGCLNYERGEYKEAIRYFEVCLQNRILIPFVWCYLFDIDRRCGGKGAYAEKIGEYLVLNLSDSIGEDRRTLLCSDFMDVLTADVREAIRLLEYASEQIPWMRFVLDNPRIEPQVTPARVALERVLKGLCNREGVERGRCFFMLNFEKLLLKKVSAPVNNPLKQSSHHSDNPFVYVMQ